MDVVEIVKYEMINYFKGDAKRINHFLKVHSFAKLIGENENISQEVLKILEIASLTHDIGIKNSEKKHQSSAGKYQEMEGPAEARILLEKIGIKENIIERVAWLIAHHHTYHNIIGMDYQILVEADFLVNSQEDQLDFERIQKGKGKIFKTKTGLDLLNKITA